MHHRSDRGRPDLRTTPNIDDDLMADASELPPSPQAGFKPYPALPGVVVTDEEVNAWREIEGI